MPQDKNGNSIEPGMIILVKMRVNTVSQSEDYCNIDVETVEPCYPGDSPIRTALNGKQVEVIG